MRSAKCVACGLVGLSDVGYCKGCGAPFNPQVMNLAGPGSAPGSWESAEKPKKALAVLALVLGIFSFLTLGLFGIGAIVGIILGVVAMNRVKSEPWKYGGRGIAIAGLVLSATSLAIGVPIGIIAAIAIPNFMAARMAANEASAIHSLHDIASAEVTYQNQFQKYGTLSELAEVGLIDQTLASGVKNGYHFTVEATGNDPSASGFAASCLPVEYRKSGRRSFFTDETFVIRVADNRGAPATASDRPLREEAPSVPPVRVAH